jgi:hypothetical protein
MKRWTGSSAGPAARKMLEQFLDQVAKLRPNTLVTVSPELRPHRARIRASGEVRSLDELVAEWPKAIACQTVNKPVDKVWKLGLEQHICDALRS